MSNPPAGRKVFLAGSTGLVGTAILRQLLDDSPDTLVRASRHSDIGPWIHDPRIEYVSGDLRSLETCRLIARGVDCAIMAAAYTGGAGLVNGFSWRHIKENLWLNLQMLEAFQLEQVPRIVLIGSATIYQDSDRPVSENDLDLNQDPPPPYLGYGWAARLIEKTCRLIHEQCAMQVVIVRAANVFGPYARFDPVTSNVIPALIRKAVDKTDPFEVWGDPSVTRDVIYSEDFAEAIVKLADRNGEGFEVFNVGSGESTTIDQIVQWTLKAAGHEPRAITYLHDRPTTMKNRALDCSKIRRVLDWAPRHTIEEGIGHTTRWWIDNKSSWMR